MADTITVERDDLERIIDAYDTLASELEQLQAIEGIGECTRCSTPIHHCARCGDKLALPQVLERPDPLDEFTIRRLRKIIGHPGVSGLAPH